MTVEFYRQHLTQIFSQRQWIISSNVLAACTGIVNGLGQLGATECLCLAGSRGTGALPDEQLAPIQLNLDIQSSSMMEDIRQSMVAMQHLPKDIIEAIDDFDPDGTTPIIGPLYDDGKNIAGRAKFGRRQQTWLDLEDKTTIDALWAHLNIPHAPYKIVDANDPNLDKIAQELDEGHGTVWSADNKEGFHGGAQYTRRIHTDDHLKQARHFFAQHSDRLRIMPYLPGIPCSIHAMVFRDQTITFRPCEMIVFQKQDGTQFHYASTATYWDPPTSERDNMKRIAHNVGEHLRKSINYRGFLTVDGIMTTRGFLPTELNPRFGAAVGHLAAGLKDLHIYLLNIAVVEDLDIDWQPKQLETLLLNNADSNRGLSAHSLTTRRIEHTEEIGLLWHDGHFTTTTALDRAHATAKLGPAPSGGIAFLRANPDILTIGRSVAPLVAQAFATINQHWQLGWDNFTPAQDVHAIT